MTAPCSRCGRWGRRPNRLRAVPPILSRRPNRLRAVPPVLSRRPNRLRAVPPVLSRRPKRQPAVPPVLGRRPKRQPAVPPVLDRRPKRQSAVPPVLGPRPNRLRAVLLVLGLALALACPAAAQPPTLDLRDAYGRGLVEDRNGDGVVDFVPTRILVPAAATEAELVAAANVAARLGYETSALDPGLLARDDGASEFDGPVVVIGGAAPAAAGTLAPGQGAVLPIVAADRFRGGGVRIVGYDASGLLAAAAYFAGRYPNVWGMRGTTYGEVASRLARHLAGTGADTATVTLDVIVVDGQRAGVLRLGASVRARDAAAFDSAVHVLQPSARDTADAAADTARGAQADSARGGNGDRSSLDIQDLHRIDVTISGPDSSTVVRVLPSRPWDTEEASAYAARNGTDFTLSDLYTIRGLYRDTNSDLVPDRTEAYISLDGADGARGVVDIAARIGLETAGIRLPIAEVAGEEDRASDVGLPILVGAGHYQLARLRRERRLHASDFTEGEGFIELVPRAFDGRHALVVGGSDALGFAAAADYFAGRMPYLWSYGKGEYTLAEVETDVRRFVQARTGGGQVALAVHTLDRWLERLDTLTVDSLHVGIAAHDVETGLGAFAAQRVLARFPAARATAEVHATGFGVGREIFTEDVRFPWEVDEARTAVRDEALPALDPGTRGRIEVRVSEPPEIRRQLADEIRALLSGRGIAADAYDVVVLSAYKQGYSWLEEVILPRLRDLPVARIEIAYHTLRDSREVRWQAIESDTRWLQEIYPIDVVLARELGIADSAITFTPTVERDPIYRVRAFDAAGAEILTETFDPKYVVRPFFDLFPEYEQVRVTTGWVTVTENGTTVLDRRIRTDPEAFWDHLQTETYAKIVDYMIDVQDGRPSPANAPYFDEFRVELALSEPNYRIGVDEEVVSSLEALHEDIYFETLTLFDLIGGRYNVDGLQFAGRVLPYILPTGTGKPGRAKITFTGKTRAIPELSLTYRVRGQDPVRWRYPLSPLPLDPPKLRGIAVRADESGNATSVARLLFEVAVEDSVDRWDELRFRSTEAAIDRTLASTALLEGMLAVARDLHAAGLYQEAGSLDRVAAIRFRLTVGDTLSRHARTFDLPRSGRPASTDRPVLVARNFRHDGRRLVQWETPIPPAESDSVLAQLNTFPGVTVYRVGRSFLGRPIFAADFTAPAQARYVSQAKLNALKPTVFLSGRQHANEVSSTSHILRLGELLATDSSYRALLDRVNVVLHPITNPDGAQLAYEMQLTNPDFMLHAGYLGALGVDATSGANSDDPIYPESKVRPHLLETWLPDIYINMHGYPSHEWVQMFAGYSAWVRSRIGTQRSWWAPRGWFIPGFTHFEDDNEPKWERAQFAVLDSIAAAITGDSAVQAMNERMYVRYQKYGKQDIDNFREHFHNGMLTYMGIRPREATGQGTNDPRITWFSTTTEAPDETARGEWLELVASAGLAHGAALVRYLASGENEVKRESAEYRDFVTRSVFRVKPVIPRD